MMVMSAIFQKAAVGGDDGEGGVFPGGGIAQQADEKALKGVQPGVARGDAEGKRNGQIAQADGQPVAETGE